MNSKICVKIELDNQVLANALIEMKNQADRMACLYAMQGNIEKLKHYQREAAQLQGQVQRWDQERVISKETLHRFSELESAQNRANAKRPRKPKIPVTDIVQK